MREGGASSIASACCTLGYVLHFLLTGSLRHGSGAPLRAGEKPSGVERISVDAEIAISGLTKADPDSRLGPAGFLRTTWASSVSDAAQQGGAAEVLPKEIHGELNAWFDAFTYQSLCSKLELMNTEG